jgi:hypothetical protein
MILGSTPLTMIGGIGMADLATLVQEALGLTVQATMAFHEEWDKASARLFKTLAGRPGELKAAIETAKWSQRFFAALADRVRKRCR